MRPIDADALIDSVTEANNILEKHGIDTTVGRLVITIAENAPTVGQKRGRWVEDDHILICSKCEQVAMQRVYYSLTHNVTDIPMVRTPYCPHCGAKMEMEGER